MAELRIRNHNPDGETFERSECCSFGYCDGGGGMGGAHQEFSDAHLSKFLGLLQLFPIHCRPGFN